MEDSSATGSMSGGGSSSSWWRCNDDAAGDHGSDRTMIRKRPAAAAAPQVLRTDSADFDGRGTSSRRRSSSRRRPAPASGPISSRSRYNGVASGSTVSFLVSLLSALLLLLLGPKEVAGQSCKICGEDMVIGSPSNVVQDPVSGNYITCAELQSRTQMHTFVQCLIVQSSIVGFCGCRDFVDIPTDPPEEEEDDNGSSIIIPDLPPSTPCSICGEDMMMGAPANYVRDPKFGDRITCAELDYRVVNYSFLDCQIARASSSVICQCGKNPPPAPTPVPQQQTWPVSQPWPTAPAGTPSLSDPVDNTPPSWPSNPALPHVRGWISMVLEDVAGEMPDMTKASFEDQTTAFLMDSFADMTTVQYADTYVVEQVFTPADDSRRRRLLRLRLVEAADSASSRALQSNNQEFRPLELVLEVSGGQQPQNGYVN